jgi:hypothetical protein
MLRVRSESILDSSDTDSSSDNFRIPEIRPSTLVEAKDMKVGDLIPRWAGGYGIIVGRETVVGKSIQIMTNNGHLMLDKNIITCHVAPYGFSYYGSKPVKLLSSISPYLVKRPFYSIPKRIYKHLA